jgi:hypothetical protein
MLQYTPRGQQLDQKTEIENEHPVRVQLEKRALGRAPPIDNKRKVVCPDIGAGSDPRPAF